MSKIKAELQPSGNQGKVWIDSKEITTLLTGIDISSHVGNFTQVKLSIVPRKVLIVDAEPEVLMYVGPNGEQLIPLANALNIWHCACGTWNRMHQSNCIDCSRERPEQAVQTVEFEIAFHFDISIFEPDIGEAATQKLRDLMSHVPSELWNAFRVTMCNRTADEQERKRLACTEPTASNESSTPSSPLSLPLEETDNESSN